MIGAAALIWFTVCFLGKRGLDDNAGVVVDFDIEEMVGGRMADDLDAGREEDDDPARDEVFFRDEGGGGIGDSLTVGRAVEEDGGGIGDSRCIDES